MKWFSIFAAGISVLCVLSVRAELVSGISVVVNDAVITYAEIEDQVERGAATAAKVYANNPQRYDQEILKLRSQDIELLVEDKLIVHEFTTSGYTTNVLEAFIDDQIRQDIQRDYYGDRTRLIKTLKARGMTYEEYRRQQREEFIIRFMKYQNGSNLKKVLVSPLKIQEYYEGHKELFNVNDQVHLRTIFVKQEADYASGEARKIADEILTKIDSGIPFAEMAGVYSSDSYRAEGGDRSWVERTDLKSELSTIAFSLKPGQHSGVIEQPEGCYLMMVEDVRSAHVRPEAEVRDEIELTLKRDESSRLYKNWIERLKRKSFINYY
jgi:peptidyl-prolyl cis-trans isomerase SurA